MDNTNIKNSYKYASQKSKEKEYFWMTIFTPAYQREKTMKRLYKSLIDIKLPKDQNGNSVEFEWLIIDDGSTDGTEELVSKWCKENILPIRYYYQKNQGKHVAENFATLHSRSEMILTMDSDDTLLPNALEVFYSEWQKIDNKQEYKGITCRSIDPETGEIMGSKLPSNTYYFDANTRDMRLKYHIKGEMCGFNRLDLKKAYPFPTPDDRMRFCPEDIVWYEMAKKYKERIVDIPVRKYYKDTSNSITGKNKNRSISNYYFWQYMVNNLLSYMIYSPITILKSIVGMSMDGFNTDRSVKQILNDIKPLLGKILVTIFIPAGFILSKR